MGDNEGGRGPGDGPRPDDDPFAQLLDPAFASAAAPPEPSAEERARQAEREARAADLERRLTEDHSRDEGAAADTRRAGRRQARRHRLRRLAGPAIVVVLVVAVIYTESGGRDNTLADGPPPPANPSPTPLGSVPPVPAEDGPFTFVAKQPSGEGPVAYDPCRPIHYVVNTTEAPPGTEVLVQQAVANAAEATGLTFIADGSTDEAYSQDRKGYQPDRYGDRWAPVLIDWSTPEAVPELAGDVAGLGGSASVQTDDDRSVFVTGAVALDARDLGPLLSVPDGPQIVLGVIQHELGHVMGLGHVKDENQLMFASESPGAPQSWGAGDLRGLHALGSGSCFPDV